MTGATTDAVVEVAVHIVVVETAAASEGEARAVDEKVGVAAAAEAEDDELGLEVRPLRQEPERRWLG
jgi:hypothetical protein